MGGEREALNATGVVARSGTRLLPWSPEGEEGPWLPPPRVCREGACPDGGAWLRRAGRQEPAPRCHGDGRGRAAAQARPPPSHGGGRRRPGGCPGSGRRGDGDDSGGSVRWVPVGHDSSRFPRRRRPRYRQRPSAAGCGRRAPTPPPRPRSSWAWPGGCCDAPRPGSATWNGGGPRR